MKKIKLTSLLTLLSLGFNNLFAQIIETPYPDLPQTKVTSEDLNFLNRSINNNLNKKQVVSGWYAYTKGLDDNGETFTYFTGTHMWPDSLPFLNFATTPGHVGLHGIGQVFDPKSLFFLEPTPSLNQHNPYTIDSIAFFYKYLNLTGIADTLLFQYYGNDKIANVSFGTTPSRSIVLNRTLSRGQSSTGEIKIPLNVSDNTADFFGTGTNKFSGVMQIPTGLIIPKNGLGAFTATFIPGNYPVALGDTLAIDANNIPVKKLNCFVPLIFRGDGVASSLDNSFNIGLFEFSDQKYSTRATEWFYPANAPGTNKQFVVSQFHITCQNYAINPISKVLKIYPNPIEAGDKVSFEGVNGSFEYVLTDIQGRIVDQGTGDSGSMNTSDNLVTGTYFLQLNSKGTSYKATLVIQ